MTCYPARNVQSSEDLLPGSLQFCILPTLVARISPVSFEGRRVKGIGQFLFGLNGIIKEIQYGSVG